jgi:hydrogenase maturation protease
MKRITVGGIGNVLLGDDGVGPYVVSLLEERYSLPDYVEVVDFGTPSLDLLEHVADAEAVILIDAAENGKPPGTLTRYSKADVLREHPAPRLDPHSPALGATLAAAELLGTAPASFLLIGITPETLAEGLSLTAGVRAAAQCAVEMVIEELRASGIPVEARQDATGSVSCWERLYSRESPRLQIGQL